MFSDAKVPIGSGNFAKICSVKLFRTVQTLQIEMTSTTFESAVLWNLQYLRHCFKYICVPITSSNDHNQTLEVNTDSRQAFLWKCNLCLLLLRTIFCYRRFDDQYRCRRLSQSPIHSAILDSRCGDNHFVYRRTFGSVSPYSLLRSDVELDPEVQIVDSSSQTVSLAPKTLSNFAPDDELGR